MSKTELTTTTNVAALPLPLNSQKNRIEKGILALATSHPATTVSECLALGNKSTELEERTALYNDRTGLQVYTTNGNRDLEITNETAKKIDRIVIGNYNDLMPSDTVSKKLFCIVCSAVIEQSYRNGNITTKQIAIPLSDFVDRFQMYKDVRDARHAVKTHVGTLCGIRYSCEYKKAKKNGVSARGGVLFPEWEIRRGVLYISISDAPQWKEFLAQWVSVSAACMALPSRGFDLYIAIAARCRSNAAKIKKNGYLFLSARYLHKKLRLPHENQTKSPKRDIFDKLEESINDVIAMLRANGDNETKIEIDFAPNESVASFLDTGGIRVYPSLAFCSEALEISERSAEKKEATARRVERAKTKAIQKAEEDRLREAYKEKITPSEE